MAELIESISLDQVKQGGLTVLDQGLFSGTSFIMNVLLARWLPAEEYGAFAVAFSLFLLLAAFHTAILTEPMMVFGPSKYEDRFESYLGALIVAHGIIAGLFVVILLITVLLLRAMGQVLLASASVGLAAAIPFLLLLWLTRRAFYSTLQPQRSVVPSGIFLFLSVLGLGSLVLVEGVTPAAAFIVTGASAVVSSGVAVFMLRPQIRPLSAGDVSVRGVLQEHYGYGRWATLNTVFIEVSRNLITFMVAGMVGLAGTGAFAAIQTLYRPYNLIAQLVPIVLLPYLASIVDDHGRWNRAIVRVIIGSVGIALAYSATVVILFPLLDTYVFASKYGAYDELAIIVGVAVVLSMGSTVLSIGLKSMEKAKEAAIAWGYSSGLQVVLAPALISIMGVAGAAGAGVIKNLAGIVLLSKRYRAARSGQQVSGT